MQGRVNGLYTYKSGPKMTLLHSVQFRLRRDVICGTLRAALQVTLKRTCFAAIPYITRAFYGNYSLKIIRNYITSYLEVGHSVHTSLHPCLCE